MPRKIEFILITSQRWYTAWKLLDAALRVLISGRLHVDLTLPDEAEE